MVDGGLGIRGKNPKSEIQNPKSVDLSTRIGPLCLKNPVLTASGTFGYGSEYADLVDLSRLGGIVTKAVTPEPRAGNPPPRVVETTGGMLNAIGLANVGVNAFVWEKMPFLRTCGTTVIVNVAGRTVEDYVHVARVLDPCPGVHGLEINVSCPNVREGGLSFGASPARTAEVVRKLKTVTDLPLIVKLTPNVTDIVAVARAAEEAGADALSLINTLVGMAIDVDTRRPKLGNITGGLSGPAIRPVAVAMVWKVAQQVRIPVIGIGGVTCAADALEFLIAGACAVQVGTATFIEPRTVLQVVVGLEQYLLREGFCSLSDVVGSLET